MSTQTNRLPQELRDTTLFMIRYNSRLWRCSCAPFRRLNSPELLPAVAGSNITTAYRSEEANTRGRRLICLHTH